MSSGVTGALLRERDKRVESERDKALEQRNSRLKQENNDLLQQLFEARNAREEALTALDEALVKVETLSSESEQSQMREQVVELKLQELQRRYDDLHATHERAIERYKSDLEKWLRFKEHVFDDEALKAAKKAGLSPAELKKVQNIAFARKKKEIRAMMEKENISADAVVNILVANSSQPEASSPAKSSETEDDESQANTKVTPALSVVPISTSTPRQKQLDTAAPPTPLTFSTKPVAGTRRKSDGLPLEGEPANKSRRLSADSQKSDRAGPSKADASVSASAKQSKSAVRPPLSDVFVSPIPTATRSSAVHAGSSTSITRPKYTKPTDDIFFTTPAISKSATASSSKGKSKALPIEEYAKYKGRGRYAAKEDNIDDDSDYNRPITSMFAISPSRNKGVDYQFDEVVRDKQERKKLHGGDCMCCKDYYEALAPLPARLQPPLWRSPGSTPAYLRTSSPNASPTSTPTKSKHRPKNSPSKKNRKSVEAHKNQISRHRHEWAPSTTPPRYWAIGFPNTQEVQAINDAAKEMHKRKVDEIRKEADNVDKGRRGRWKRK